MQYRINKHNAANAAKGTTMSRITKLDLYLQTNSAETMMQQWNLGGVNRALLVEAIGYANEGATYNALRDAGYIDGGTVNTGTRQTARKVKGCLPFKTANAVARILNLDPEENDIGWDEFKQALSMQSDSENWLGLLYHRLGGEDSDGGKSLSAWISSNMAIDSATAAAAARAADPTIKLREQIKSLNSEIEELKAQLETERAKPRSNGRINRGGELTAEMLKLLKQRFHPDKQNGNDPVMYNAIMQWLNAIDV